MHISDVKKVADSNAKLMLEETVRRINKQFQLEVSGIVGDFRELKLDLARRDKEIRDLKEFIVVQEQNQVHLNVKDAAATMIEMRLGADQT